MNLFQRHRGFSLLETLIVMVLAVMLLGLGLRNLGSQKARAGSEGLVQVVAAELESARAKALSSRLPVAFCLPSANGSRPHSDSFYLMEGEVTPRATETRVLSGDFPDSFVAVVAWGSPTLSRPANAGSYPANAVATWLKSRVAKDYALVFMPDGSVMSNDLPLMDGEYRLLVASGIRSEAGGPARPRLMPISPNGFLLKEAFAAHTISLSPNGEIRVEPGVKNPDGVIVATQKMGITSTPATLLPPLSPAASNPTISSVSVFPKPFLEPKATVQQERNLSLTVEAKDDDGQQLFCTWEAVPQGSATGEGAFSLPDQHPMVWNRTRACWTSQCTWAPPPSANAGDRYMLTCRVNDGDGNVVSDATNILNPVTVIPPGQIFFWRLDPRFTRYKVATINTDGTALRDLNDSKENNTCPSVSPDGSKLAWVSRDLDPNGEIFVMNSDGTGRTQISNTTDEIYTTCWSPDGDKILFSSSGPSSLYLCNADGSNVQALPKIGDGPGFQAARAITFSPDGRYIAYRSRFSANDIVVGEYDRGSVPIIKDANAVTSNTVGSFEDENVLAFVPGSPDNRVIWASMWMDTSTAPFSYHHKVTTARLKDNGTGATPRFELVDVQSMGTAPMRDIVFSPDGKKVLFNPETPQGMAIGDWNDNGALPPTITNRRKLSPGTESQYPCAWTR